MNTLDLDLRKIMTVSTRAQVITRRTYNRPKDETGKVFETWAETVSKIGRASCRERV